ncbi:hypothetical protein [Bremerella sp. P1]|uniref:hypothetical protein n=1 Tax=Bremerella sp. P1 TaxID=3026424 RepID=UPI0023687F14|nr:hypothetical protein [Bremerella sp. P1]WDI41840.1 hypothetical protein PSR63_25645 [Bremerella sp. P1]
MERQFHQPSRGDAMSEITKIEALTEACLATLGKTAVTIDPKSFLTDKKQRFVMNALKAKSDVPVRLNQFVHDCKVPYIAFIKLTQLGLLIGDEYHVIVPHGDFLIPAGKNGFKATPLAIVCFKLSEAKVKKLASEIGQFVLVLKPIQFMRKSKST